MNFIFSSQFFNNSFYVLCELNFFFCNIFKRLPDELNIQIVWGIIDFCFWVKEVVFLFFLILNVMPSSKYSHVFFMYFYLELVLCVNRCFVCVVNVVLLVCDIESIIQNKV